MANVGLGKRKAYHIKFPVPMAEQLEEMAEFYGVSVQALVQMIIGQNLRASDKLLGSLGEKVSDEVVSTGEMIQQAIKRALEGPQV